MEAFILEERVLTAQHMSRLDHRDLKYIKKYDLPTRSSYMTSTPKADHTHKESRINRTPPINFRKIKNLLSTLTQGIEGRTLNNKTLKAHKVDKYFLSLSDSSKALGEVKKSKSSLLIRRINPHSQQYDANLDAVSHRSPCWTFSPHERVIGENLKNDALILENQVVRAKRIKTSEKRVRKDRNAGLNRASESEEYVLEKVQRKIYEEMRQRSGFGEYQHECKLQYSPQDLGRCASEIFKKYQLNNNDYFKKFVADIQQL